MLCWFLAFSAELQAQINKEEFVWGINGHPLTQQEYNYKTLNDQIRFLSDLGVNYYRIDVPIAKDGQARNETYLLDLLDKLKASNIKPMFAIFPKGNKNYSDSLAVYQYYFSIGQKFVERYGKYLDVVEVGNEWDLKLMKKNAMNDGRKASHYQTTLIGKQMWLLAGIVDGLKSKKPSLKVSMSLTWVHWYYLDILKRYKINYDIIGYHWYSNMGNITNVTPPYGDILPKIEKKYNKEIWITEFNTYQGTKKASFEKQESYIKGSLNDIVRQGIVKGFFIYELFDQPSLTNYPAEMSYGLLYKEQGKYKTKPVYKTFKEIIKRSK